MASHWPAPAKHITQSSPSASVQACKTYSAHRESKNEGFTDKFFLTFLFGFCESSMRKRTKKNGTSALLTAYTYRPTTILACFFILRQFSALPFEILYFGRFVLDKQHQRGALSLALLPHSLLSSAGLMKRSWPCPSARRRSFLLSIIKVG